MKLNCEGLVSLRLKTTYKRIHVKRRARLLNPLFFNYKYINKYLLGSIWRITFHDKITKINFKFSKESVALHFMEKECPKPTNLHSYSVILAGYGRTVRFSVILNASPKMKPSLPAAQQLSIYKHLLL